MCIFVRSYGQEMWYFPFILLGITLCTVAVTGIFWSAQRFVRAVAFVSLVPALVLAVGLSTWLLGVRSKGVYGFHVAPATLTRLTSDRRIFDQQIHEELRREGAKRVIVAPTLFHSFLADIGHMPDIEAFTWNPLSDQTDTHFDHAVLMLGGNDEIVPPALTEYTCTSEAMIVSPNGYYEAAVLKLIYQPFERHAFIECK